MSGGQQRQCWRSLLLPNPESGGRMEAHGGPRVAPEGPEPTGLSSLSLLPFLGTSLASVPAPLLSCRPTVQLPTTTPRVPISPPSPAHIPRSSLSTQHERLAAVCPPCHPVSLAFTSQTEG